MAERLKFTIIVPVFNEAENLGTLLERLESAKPEKSEILVIDDGSTDGSGDVARAKGARVIRHPYNIGNGAAVKTGIRAARGATLILMDGDGQHPPEDISRLVAASADYDMVVGARAKGSRWRMHRYLANWIFNRIASYVTKFNVKDLTSGFRLLRREHALRFIDLLPNEFSYPSTLTLAFLRSGLTIKYIPVQSLYRSGQSKISLVSDGLRFLLIIAKIATLFAPLRVFLPVSGFFFVAGAGYYIYTYVTEGRFTNMAVFLLTTAVIIFMMGLVSEQIAIFRMEGKAAGNSNSHHLPPD
jgi:glycosyltransferase involved in cell wall biosynthesis